MTETISLPIKRLSRGLRCIKFPATHFHEDENNYENNYEIRSKTNVIGDILDITAEKATDKEQMFEIIESEKRKIETMPLKTQVTRPLAVSEKKKVPEVRTLKVPDMDIESLDETKNVLINAPNCLETLELYKKTYYYEIKPQVEARGLLGRPDFIFSDLNPRIKIETIFDPKYIVVDIKKSKNSFFYDCDALQVKMYMWVLDEMLRDKPHKIEGQLFYFEDDIIDDVELGKGDIDRIKELQTDTLDLIYDSGKFYSFKPDKRKTCKSLHCNYCWNY